MENHKTIREKVLSHIEIFCGEFTSFSDQLDSGKKLPVKVLGYSDYPVEEIETSIIVITKDVHINKSEIANTI